MMFNEALCFRFQARKAPSMVDCPWKYWSREGWRKWAVPGSKHKEKES